MPSDTHNNLQIHHRVFIATKKNLPRPLPLLVAWEVGGFLFVYLGKPFMNVRVLSECGKPAVGDAGRQLCRT